jgi:succinylglutamic semialdehyde dehydrogenase
MNSNVESAHAMKVFQPGTRRLVWEGRSVTATEIHAAVDRAKQAAESWRREPLDRRIAVAQQFAEITTRRRDEMAERICLETGKPRWEAESEAALVPAKVKLSIEAHQRRCGGEDVTLPQGLGHTDYRPIGVMAVLGPFNFPAHLPNGHIVPSLVAGNCVVFKPSEMTPGTGSLLAECWRSAGLPDGVLQVVQGGREVGAALVNTPIDGVLFTGSHAAGCAIHRALAGRPEVMLALEMGGNSPLVVGDIEDLDAAAYLINVSAFITAGQRCTCARRLIIPSDDHLDALLQRVVQRARSLRVGMPDEDPQPFLGPLISEAAAERVLQAQSSLVAKGGRSLLAAQRSEHNAALLTPGIVDVTAVADRGDEEVFGPLLQVIRVENVSAAIAEANRTAYGLAASLLSDDADQFQRFRNEVRAGVINWNQPTVGASGRLPFGGLGASGNHRPSGFHAADYCSDATAVLQASRLAMPQTKMPGSGE